MTKDKRPATVVLLSPCGWGNLGDAAIMRCAIEALQIRLPFCTIVAGTLNPKDTQLRHSISSIPISGYSNSQYLISHTSACKSPLFISIVSKYQTFISRYYKLGKIIQFLIRPIEICTQEFRNILSCLRVLSRCDAVVVCGGGQLDEYWGGPWGHPYALVKWSILAKLTGTAFVILSTGLGVLDSSLSKRFIHTTIRLSCYSSFRDSHTVSFVRSLAAATPLVECPDLAFSLAVTSHVSGHRESTAAPVVGINPIAWMDPRCWPEKNKPLYDDYFARLFSIISNLLAQSSPIILLPTSNSDKRVTAELSKFIQMHCTAEQRAKVSIPAIDTLDDLCYQLTLVDCVVASRLHAILLSFTLNRPVVALSYNWKVNILMNEFHQEDFLLDITNFNPHEVESRISSLMLNYSSISHTIHTTARDYKTRVDAQYDVIIDQLAL